MYLLNHKELLTVSVGRQFTFHYVSIKSNKADNIDSKADTFTFHYVSIKSDKIVVRLDQSHNLHSTMYLLNLLERKKQSKDHYDLHSTMYLLNPVLLYVYIM